jgi:orotidine-5'-phosphate decarboxylase
MNFIDKIKKSQMLNNSLLCVGLDSDVRLIPSHLKLESNPLFKFNKNVIDCTSGAICSYKINSAFYEACGQEGLAQLKLTFDYIHAKHPEIPVILDAKRGDIGSSNEAYADYAFKYLDADAITLNPYLGKDALRPFLDQKDKGCVIICKTSNPKSGEFQDLIVNNCPFYLLIAKSVNDYWNYNQNCCLVVGATHPHDLRKIRRAVGDMFLLVPGIGNQGGDLRKTLQYGLTNSNGLIINASRSIIFADPTKNFSITAGLEASKLKDEINKIKNML